MIDSSKRFVDGVDFAVHALSDFDAGQLIGVAELDDFLAARCQLCEALAEGFELFAGAEGCAVVLVRFEFREDGFAKEDLLAAFFAK